MMGDGMGCWEGDNGLLEEFGWFDGIGLSNLEVVGEEENGGVVKNLY